MSQQEKNRIDYFSNEKVKSGLRKLETNKSGISSNFDVFYKYFFSNETKFLYFIKFFNKLSAKELSDKDIYSKFACDLEWAKKLDNCKGSTSNTNSEEGKNTKNKKNQSGEENNKPKKETPNTSIKYTKITYTEQNILGGDNEIKKGDEGEVVKKIKNYLSQLKNNSDEPYFQGYIENIKADEDFVKAVQDFQTEKNIRRKDGVVDSTTLKYLQDEIKKNTRVSSPDSDWTNEEEEEKYKLLKSKIFKILKENVLDEKFEKQKQNLIKARELGCIRKNLTYTNGYYNNQKQEKTFVWEYKNTENKTVLIFGDITDDGSITYYNYDTTEWMSKTCEAWTVNTQTTKVNAVQPELDKQNEEEKNLNTLDRELKKYGWTTKRPEDVYMEEGGIQLFYVPNYGSKLKEKYKINPMVYPFKNKENENNEEENYLSKDFCKRKVEELYKMFQYPDSEPAKEYKKQPLLLLKLKIQVRKCEANDLLKRSDELKTLNNYSSTSKYFGLADFKRTDESMKNIKKTIKESLKEISVKKKNLLKEGRIINRRFQMIAENLNSNQKNKFYNEILSEIIYLNSQGFEPQIINEEFTEFLKSIFGHKWDAIGQTFSEYIMEWVLKKLGLPKDSIWSDMISTSFANLPLTKISTILTCDGMTKWLSVSLIEGMTKHLQTKAGLDNLFVDSLRNAMVETIKNDTEFGKKVEGILSKLVCPGLSSLQGKFDGQEEQMKNAALSIN